MLLLKTTFNKNDYFLEYNHTLDEYLEMYGNQYSNGELWDYSAEDFEGGGMNPNPKILYWVIDVNGERRYFETPEMYMEDYKSDSIWGSEELIEDCDDCSELDYLLK